MTASRKRSEVNSNQTPEVDIDDSRSVEITLPIGDAGPGYITNRVDLRLTDRQALTMRELLNGLKASGERLKNDYPIESNADVVRWVLESIAKRQIEAFAEKRGLDVAEAIAECEADRRKLSEANRRNPNRSE